MNLLAKILRSSRRNQLGQMAIFVALLFQVLFVFFAMVINVGLMVHDKINLQNSVDIASIYAAQKQAEILNAIAHSNYQIHQSWKLMAWRFRVLGDLGSKGGHPSKFPGGNFPDTLAPHLANGNAPTTCVNHGSWSYVYNGAGQLTQDTCSLMDGSLPQLQSTPIVFQAPYNDMFNDYIKQQQKAFQDGCRRVGTQNWQMGMRWLVAFKMDVANRKKVVRALAQNLSQPYFNELTGGNVLDGVRKTLLANLTRSNRDSIDVSSIQLFNSMAGVPDHEWLPQILANPVFYYMDTVDTASGCKYPRKIANLDWGGSMPQHITAADDPGGFLRAMAAEPDALDEYRSISGYEKNPWFMTYVGLKVSTKPKAPFSPFGRGVHMTARSFAQPFGGRIGPWLQKQWQMSDNHSSGEKVDALSQERVGSTFTPQPITMVPNFSRFPGDTIGLQSGLSLTQLQALQQMGPAGKVLDQDYAFVPSDLNQPNGDVLAWNFNNTQPLIRSYELAGIAPNFFDAMYYSIEPNFYGNYVVPITSSPNNIFGQGFALRQDLGARPELPIFTVMEQVTAYKSVFPQHPYYYQVTNAPGQLLTSWAPEGSVDYRFPSSFAECQVEVAPIYTQKQIPVPGHCVSGGRTGYSVKIISKNFLKSSDLELGGEGVRGPIRNPPPDDF